MELSLKLELTDDQYKNLMESSYDAIFKDEQTIEALKNLVVSQFNDYLSKNPSYIYQVLFERKPNNWSYSHDRFQSEADKEAFIKNLFEQALSERAAELKDTFTEITNKFLTTMKPEDIIVSIIMHTIEYGINGGFIKWRENREIEDQIKNATMRDEIHSMIMDAIHR